MRVEEEEEGLRWQEEKRQSLGEIKKEKAVRRKQSEGEMGGTRDRKSDRRR